MRFLAVPAGVLALAGCADFAQNLYDSWAGDNCSRGKTSDQQWA
jgi:hypothetical protein